MYAIKSLGLATLASLFVIHSASAQSDEQTAPNPQGSWGANFGVEQVSIDKDKAWWEGIDDSATAIFFEGEYYFHQHYSTAFGLSFLMYDDNASFSQDTTGGYESSDASGMPIYADVGYKRFLGAAGKTYVTTRIGFSAMVQSDRSISNCVDCYEEDIDIDGGVYGHLGAGVRLGSSWLLGVNYKNYFTGDLKNSIGLNISYSYF